jgi:hypothetical protein
MLFTILHKKPRHIAKNLLFQVHEASLSAKSMLAVQFPHQSWQAGINETKDIGQDHVLKGGRNLLIFCQNHIVLPGHDVPLFPQASKDQAPVLIVEAFRAHSCLVFQVPELEEMCFSLLRLKSQRKFRQFKSILVGHSLWISWAHKTPSYDTNMLPKVFFDKKTVFIKF